MQRILNDHYIPGLFHFPNNLETDMKKHKQPRQIFDSFQELQMLRDVEREYMDIHFGDEDWKQISHSDMFISNKGRIVNKGNAIHSTLIAGTRKIQISYNVSRPQWISIDWLIENAFGEKEV
jgi:hypothetical protein